MLTCQHNLPGANFKKLTSGVGTVMSAVVFEDAKNPSYKMEIDFGDMGIRKTSAQITVLYSPEELIGQQVLAVVNFPPKQIATMMSECLVLGAIGQQGAVTIISPNLPVKNGLKIG